MKVTEGRFSLIATDRIAHTHIQPNRLWLANQKAKSRGATNKGSA
jgi:hypothetical protein